MFLTKKIETKEDFQRAKDYGCDYFQGPYFSQPSLIEHKSVTPLQISALKVIGMLQNDSCGVEEIASVIRYDPGLAHKLCRIANSVSYGTRYRADTLHSAVMMIGLEQLRIWMMFLLTYGLHDEKPNELIKQSMLRARIAEEICKRKSLSGGASGFALLGLFSMLDAIMDAPFEKILPNISIPEDIKTALQCPDKGGMHGAVIKMIRAYEQEDWDDAEKAGLQIGLGLGEYSKIYIDAAKWCDSRFEAFTQPDKA